MSCRRQHRSIVTGELTPGPQRDADGVGDLVDAVLQLLPRRVIEPDVLRLRTRHLHSCALSESTPPAFRRPRLQAWHAARAYSQTMCIKATQARTTQLWHLKVPEQGMVAGAGDGGRDSAAPGDRIVQA